MRARTKKLSWYISWVFIWLIIISLILGFILSLPVWQIQNVEITGNKYLTQQKILATAKIPVGENIFLLDPDEVKGGLSQIMQIKSVKINRKLPATISIRISEREPFAIVVIGNITSLMDDEGYIIAKNNIASSIYRLSITDFPVIRGVTAKGLENGNRVNDADRKFMKEAILLLSKYFESSSLQIDMSNKEDIVVFVEDVLRVKIGDTGQLDKKVKVVFALIKPIAGKWHKVKYIDVRLPENPVIRFL